MDPAVKAATELNIIFHRLEVPCEVRVTPEAGKHVCATADLEAGVALVEELPIVSWPSASLLHLRLPFCFHCLRLASHHLSANHSPATSAGATASSALPQTWTSCAQCTSCFCSATCQQASARAHRLLCPSLGELRRPDSASAATTATVSSGITVESLARCVAWVVQRLSTVVEQQKLTYAVLQADYAAQRSAAGAGCEGGSVAWSSDSLNYQLFTQVVAPFSRLISPPDSVRFEGVSLPAWSAKVRTLLAERCVKVLLVASGAPLGKLQLHSLDFSEKGTDESSASSLHWAEALVSTLFSTDTLRTLVGQMVLNAHGVNDYVLPASSSCNGEVPEGETAPAARGTFEWILKGAGLYALLASFNHSCEPNSAVSSVEETHEIVLKTTRAVRAGEEITITYIPVTASTTLAERQQLLKNYFFTCRCPRCVSETKA